MSFQDKLVYAFDLLNKLQDDYKAEDVGGNVAQKLQFCQDEKTLDSVTDFLQEHLLDAMKNAAEDASWLALLDDGRTPEEVQYDTRLAETLDAQDEAQCD